MNRLSPRYVVAAVAVLVAALVTFGSVPAAAPQSGSGPSGTVVPVEAATLVCPGLTSDASVSQRTYLSAGAPAPAATSTGAPTPSATSTGAPTPGTDSLRIDTLGASIAKPPLASAAAGSRSVSYLVPAGPARTYVVRAAGTLAQGLSAQFITRTPAGPGRSLAAGQCAAPSGESWFVGGGAGVGRTSTVLLTNVDSAPATVDVTVYGAKGPIVAEPGQGVLVGAGKQVALAVDLLSPGEPATAVHVVARSGRFAASLFDAAASGLVPRGTDWVPQSVGPATSVVVPAIAGEAGATRVLSLVVPGPTNAVVRIGVATSGGLLVPLGYDALEVPAGQLVTLDLKAVAGTGAFGLVITSDQPLLAGVRVSRGVKAELPDFSYTAGSSPVTSPRVLTVVGATATTKAALVLTAGPVDAAVLVTILPAPGGGAAPAPVVVRVAAGRTVTMPLGPGLAVPGTILLSPVEGDPPLYAAVTVKEDAPRGPLLTTRTFGGTPASVVLPSVRPDPGLAATAAPTG